MANPIASPQFSLITAQDPITTCIILSNPAESSKISPDFPGLFPWTFSQEVLGTSPSIRHFPPSLSLFSRNPSRISLICRRKSRSFLPKIGKNPCNLAEAMVFLIQATEHFATMAISQNPRKPEEMANQFGENGCLHGRIHPHTKTPCLGQCPKPVQKHKNIRILRRKPDGKGKKSRHWRRK